MAGVPQEPADRPLEDTGAHWGTTWCRLSVGRVSFQSRDLHGLLVNPKARHELRQGATPGLPRSRGHRAGRLERVADGTPGGFCRPDTYPGRGSPQLC